MLKSYSEYKFYQSFRIPVFEADDLRFLLQIEDELGHDRYVDDAKLVDISVSGLGVKTSKALTEQDSFTVSLQFRRQQVELSAKLVRSFGDGMADGDVIFGLEFEDGHDKVQKLLEKYILSFTPDRLKECLIGSALKENYTNPSEGLEMFSLILSLFKDITHFGDQEDFTENLLTEVARILGATRGSVFLINPETNELYAVAAIGVDKKELHFDYRLGIAGCVFTTGVALNVDVMNDPSRFNESFDQQTGFETKSIICHPIHNREDKIIGVIQVLNKRGKLQFSIEDERIMKVVSLIFSSVFYEFNPVSESSQIRRFSTPFNRKNALIGRTPHTGTLRNTIIKIKDVKTPVLIIGEKGVGKNLFARILHSEGQWGLKEKCEVQCFSHDIAELERGLFSDQSAFSKAQGGTVVLRSIDQLNMDFQKRLHEVLVSGHNPGGKVSFDARVIATTSSDLSLKVSEGKFYGPLYDFLSLAQIQVEALRRRRDDIPLLVDYFMKQECQKQGLLLKKFNKKAIEKMASYEWPGNISELKRCVERAVLYNPKAHIISDKELGNEVMPLTDIDERKRIFSGLPLVNDFSVPLKERLAIVEREMILGEIRRNNGNKSKAAKEMGISREALRKKMLYSDSILEKRTTPQESSSTTESLTPKAA